MNSIAMTVGCWIFSGSVIFTSIIFELIFSIIGLSHKRENCVEGSFNMDTWFTVYVSLIFGLIAVYAFEIIWSVIKQDFTDSFSKIYLSNLIHFAILGLSIYSITYLSKDFDFLKECDGFSLKVYFGASVISLISGIFVLISKIILYIYGSKLNREILSNENLTQTFL